MVDTEIAETVISNLVTSKSIELPDPVSAKIYLEKISFCKKLNSNKDTTDSELIPFVEQNQYRFITP